MVEDVAKDGLHFKAEALRNMDVLAHLKIHVPERHAAERVSSTTVVAGVQTQDRVAEAAPNSHRIRKHVDVAVGGDAA